MAHAFSNTISGKPTFGTLRENLYQSDYINRKKGINTYCRSPLRCQRMLIASSYNVRNSYNLGVYALSLKKCNIFPVNKSNLIIGQYTKENLKDICTISTFNNCVSSYECDPCKVIAIDPLNPFSNPNIVINPSDILYQKYIIDPIGELFGKTQCGELNYTHYMRFYPPTPPLTLSTT